MEIRLKFLVLVEWEKARRGLYDGTRKTLAETLIFIGWGGGLDL
jgi:hypothetical protein